MHGGVEGIGGFGAVGEVENWSMSGLSLQATDYATCSSGRLGVPSMSQRRNNRNDEGPVRWPAWTAHLTVLMLLPYGQSPVQDLRSSPAMSPGDIAYRHALPPPLGAGEEVGGRAGWGHRYNLQR